VAADSACAGVSPGHQVAQFLMLVEISQRFLLVRTFLSGGSNQRPDPALWRNHVPLRRPGDP